MAGLGRRTHYRKHLTDSIIYDFPEPTEKERIAKVVATRGSNQFDILLALEEEQEEDTTNTTKRDSHLAILPTKFNKLVWVKRNDFVIVETGDAEGENDTGGIRYIISHILYKDQIKHLQSKGFWPQKDAEFATADQSGEKEEAATVEQQENDDGIVYEHYDEYDEFLVNTNRLAALKVDDSSSSEEDE